MEKVKKAVGNLVSKHTTTVDEEVRQPVANEHVRPQQHEKITKGVDQDIHQDHHHTTVQPVNTKEVLPEKHSYKVLPTEHKSYEHGNEKNVQSFLDREAAKYKDTSVVHDTTRETGIEAPVMGGEQVHHHVHEHVQPIIQKETVAPEVVHTTAPVHETHHAAALHHGTKVLPPKTLGEYTGERGPLQSKASHLTDEFEGCPTFDGKDLQKHSAEGVGQ